MGDAYMGKTEEGMMYHILCPQRYKVSHKETFLQDIQQVQNKRTNVWQNDLGVHLRGDRWNIMCRNILNSLFCNKIIE